VRDDLYRANVRVLGVLLNNLEEDSSAYGKNYYRHYYGEAESAPVPGTPFMK
jgi:hypothetical protein